MKDVQFTRTRLDPAPPSNGTYKTSDILKQIGLHFFVSLSAEWSETKVSEDDSEVGQTICPNKKTIENSSCNFRADENWLKKIFLFFFLYRIVWLSVAVVATIMNLREAQP